MDPYTINPSTNRKTMQNVFNNNINMFGLHAEEAQLGIVCIQDNQLTYANPYISNISGYSNYELLKMQFIELIHPDSQLILENNISLLLNGLVQTCYVCLKAIKKTGKEYWMDADLSVFTLNGNRSILAILFDVTNQAEI